MKRRRVESKLHRDVIQEILLRLPVKSLVRLKSVCKSWNSLISDPHFAKSHYELSPAPSHKLLHLASISEARSIDAYASLNNDSFVVSLIPPLPKPGKYVWVQILGSCRGLFLIKRYPNFCEAGPERNPLLGTPHNLYIWNPLTGFHRDLSYFEILEEYQYEKIYLTGFGYNSSTDDYLIIIVLRRDGDIRNRLVLFSLRTNSWKEIQSFHVPNVYSWRSSFFNDAVHWLARGEYHSHPVIVAFDLVGNNLFEIALPDVDFNYGSPFSNLVTMGECLGVCIPNKNKTKVWVMKEYRVQSSWTLIEIPMPLSAVCMTKGGEIIALSSHVAELMKFNEKGELLERCEYHCDYVSGFHLAMYTESLFSLPRNNDGSMETTSTEIIDQEK